MPELASMVIDLPEDVLKHKYAGRFEEERKLIDRLLEGDLLPLLRERLLVEREQTLRYEAVFIYPRATALTMIREHIPSFTEEELDELELDRAVEYMYVNGEKRYLGSFLDTLLKVNPAFAERAGQPIASERPLLDELIAELKRDGSSAYRIGLRAELRITEAAFRRNATVRAHLPLPQACAQQSDIELPSASGSVASETAPQRTLCIERASGENLPFVAEYRYTNRIVYTDPMSGVLPDGPVYPAAPKPCEDDLSEQAPHIVFTPLLRALAERIVGEEKRPVYMARRIYDYITQRIMYSYMRPYRLIERQAEFCVLNGKGDCGIQAILFITLCRICGIPARWQSGLAVTRTGAGCHDWAQFYVEPYGWLFADPSFGGSAWRAGALERWSFYFGNLDPLRMVANSRYQTGFTPEKRFDRCDPYDNQTGEAEWEDRGATADQLHTEYTVSLLKHVEG